MRGKSTALFGQQLNNKLKPHGYDVFTDHGGTGRSDGYLISKQGERKEIARIDIIIAKGNEVKMLVEIEEHLKSPKGVFGDILALMMTDVVRRGDGKEYKCDENTQIVVAYLPHKPFEKEKERMNVIRTRLNDMGLTADYNLVVHNDIDLLLEELEGLITNKLL